MVVTIENVLEHNDIEHVANSPHMADLYITVATPHIRDEDALSAITLLDSTESIEFTNDGMRSNIRKIASMKDRIVPEAVPGQTMMYMEREGVKISEVLQLCGYTIDDIWNCWDLTARLLWSFFSVDMPERDAKMEPISFALAHDEEVRSIMEGLGIVYDDDQAYFAEDSLFKASQPHRNRWTHSARPARMTAYATAKRGMGTVSRYWDHHRKAVREIPVLNLDQWCDLVAQSYTHLVHGYNMVFNMLDRRMEAKS